jgi:hypothetical protein
MYLLRRCRDLLILAFAALDRGNSSGDVVTLAGCNDCHTPGFFLGNPD